MNIFSSILDYDTFLTQTKTTIFLFASALFYLIACLIRFRKQLANEEYFDTTKRIPNFYIDNLIKIIIVISYIIILYNDPKINDLTRFNAYTIINIFIFHLGVIYIIFSLLSIDYYPWFLILSLFISTMQYLGLNESIFLLILSLLLCNSGLTNPPYKGRKSYDRIRSGTFVVMLILIYI